MPPHPEEANVTPDEERPPRLLKITIPVGLVLCPSAGGPPSGPVGGVGEPYKEDLEGGFCIL